MLACQIGHLREDFTTVDSAGGVVRVDDHQSLGALGDLRFDVGDIRLPVLGFVAQVVHRSAAGQRRRCRPEWVVGSRNQHLIAVVQQGLQGQRDELRNPVAQIYVVDVETWEAVDEFVAGDYRAPRRQDPLGIRIALRVGQRLDHVAHDDVGCVEAERRRVADVQLEDAVPLGLQPCGVIVYWSANLVQHVLQLRGLRERTLPRLMSRVLPWQLMSGHINYGATAVQLFSNSTTSLISAYPVGGRRERCPGP